MLRVRPDDIANLFKRRMHRALKPDMRPPPSKYHCVSLVNGFSYFSLGIGYAFIYSKRLFKRVSRISLLVFTGWQTPLNSTKRENGWLDMTAASMRLRVALTWL